MARTPERAQELMMRVWPAAVARVREEVADQQAMARRLGHDITIEPWDYRYYMEKVRQDRYNLSQDEIKPYFELDNMIEGMFYMAGQLYGLEFTRESPARCRSGIRTSAPGEVTDRAGQRRRHLLRRHVRPHRQALGRLGDQPIAAAPACSATDIVLELEQQQFHQARRRASRC